MSLFVCIQSTARKVIFYSYDMSKQKSLPYFALYPADFYTKTMRLSNEQLGRYLRLLFDQWFNGPLKEVPTDLIDLFIETKAGFINERLEEEREKSMAKHNASVKANEVRWDKRSESGRIKSGHPNHNHNHNHNKNQESKEEPIKKVKKSKTERMDLFSQNVINLGLEKYGLELCEEFANYWTESEINSKLFRAELSKNRPFDIVKRLITWNKNDKNWKKNGKQSTDEIRRGVHEGFAKDIREGKL